MMAGGNGTEKKPDLVLASSSAVRRSLLLGAGFAVDHVAPAAMDEVAASQGQPTVLRMTKAIAQAKIECVISDYPGSVVLAADTLVALGRRPLGKPCDQREAYRMLSMLQGRSHRVYSAVCVGRDDGQQKIRKCKVGSARVRMKRLDAVAIQRLLDSGQWQQGAGGYCLQGMAGTVIDHVVGDWSAIMGLPLVVTSGLLAFFGVRPDPQVLAS